MRRINVIGGGAWGTALASVLAADGVETLLWAREPEVVAAVNGENRNPFFLPGIHLSPAVRATADLAEAAAADALLLVTPAQYLGAICRELTPHLAASTALVICAKGIESRTGALMSEAVTAALPRHAFAVLSGPTFAAEVARGLPAAVTLACTDAALGQTLIDRIGRPTFRPYYSDDVIGAQIGGAVKNVLAIACGIVQGRGLGYNARAALITRGLAEMVRMGRKRGARTETLMGLSGLGDLVLTCTSEKSRNMSLGAALGKGRTLDEVMQERTSVAEGVFTADGVSDLAARIGIEMPICSAVEAVLHRSASIDETIQALLARPFTAEWT